MGLNVGVASRSANAADICGDIAGWWPKQGFEMVALADGLGHGKSAAVAAAAAIETARGWPTADLLQLFQSMDEALRPTRGAAVGVAVVDWSAGQLTYAAVGNTRAMLLHGDTTRFGAYPGIVGGRYRRLNTVTAAFNPGDVLLLWTDGLIEQIELNVADRAAPQLDDIALRLLERYRKGNDDACIIVAHLVQV